MFEGLLRRLRNDRNLPKYGLSPQLLSKLEAPPERTPDYAELAARNSNLVLLYGNEMQGGREAIADVRPVYKEVFTQDPMVMVKVLDGKKTVPVVLDPPHNALLAAKANDMGRTRIKPSPLTRFPRARIKGQLFQLTANEIKSLDNQKVNGVAFRRVRVSARIIYRGVVENHRFGLAETEDLVAEKRVFMYIGDFHLFSFAEISAKTIDLLKVREFNEIYEPRYFFSPPDWE